MENSIEATTTQQDIDFGLRSQALHTAQTIHGSTVDVRTLIENAQIIEGYLRDGRGPAPSPQQAKAA